MINSHLDFVTVNYVRPYSDQERPYENLHNPDCGDLRPPDDSDAKGCFRGGPRSTGASGGGSRGRRAGAVHDHRVLPAVGMRQPSLPPPSLVEMPLR